MSRSDKRKKSSSTRPSLSPVRSPGPHRKTMPLIEQVNELIRPKPISVSVDTLDSPPRNPPNNPQNKFWNLTAKTRELKYNIQEWILMKSIVFSLFIFSVFAVLCIFILYLAGGYLPVIILAILTSIALRPTKDHFSKTIKEFLGITNLKNQGTSFFKQSLVHITLRALRDLVHFNQKVMIPKKKKQKINTFFRHFNPTGDIYFILCVSLGWILVTKFGVEIVAYILVIIIVSDIFLRLVLDSLALLINQFSWTRKVKVSFQKNKSFSTAIDSTVATSVLFIFLICSLGCIIFMGFLLMTDIETILVNLRSSIMMLIQNINQKALQYGGIPNAIDENFVTSFLKNYNESIYSYMEKQELKGVYLLFSGIIYFPFQIFMCH